jgi:hypothetical protein
MKKTDLPEMTLEQFKKAVKNAPNIGDENFDSYIEWAVKHFPLIPTTKELEKVFGNMTHEWVVGQTINFERNKEDIIFLGELEAERVSAGTDFESVGTFQSLGYECKDGRWISGGCKF